MCTHAASEREPFPSSNRNRAVWAGAELPVSIGDVRRAVELAQAEGRKRFFLWFGPRAWDEGLHAGLESLGARSWPHVTYPALIRTTRTPVPTRPTPLTTRVIADGHAAGVMEGVRGWFSEAGAAQVVRLVGEGAAELHAACDGAAVVGVGLLMVDGGYSYLGFAGTDPADQRRGAQSALIAARVGGGAGGGGGGSRGGRNAGVPLWLKNLIGGGFETGLHGRVDPWEAGQAAG